MNLAEFKQKLKEDYGLFESKLPKFYIDILELLNDIKLSKESKVQIINFWLCVYSAQFRFRIKSRTTTNLVPINYFGFIFAPSGIGKDLTFDSVGSLFRPSMDILDNFKLEENIEWTDDLPSTGLGFSTPEGINRVSNELHSNFTLGENYIYSGEFIIEYQKNMNSDSTLAFLVEVYSNGNKFIKQLKDKSNQLKSVQGVGISALFQSDLSGMYSDYSLITKLKNNFKSGLARRSNVSLQKKILTKEYENIDYEGLLSTIREMTTDISQRRENIQKYLCDLSYKLIAKRGNLLPLSDEAEACLKLYQTYCSLEAEMIMSKNPEFKSDSISIINLKDTYFRALKLSGAIAVINNCNEIELKHLRAAISVIEYLNEGMSKFEFELNKDIYDIFIDFVNYNNPTEEVKIQSNILHKQNFISKSYSAKDLDNLAINATQRDNHGLYVHTDNVITFTPLKANNEYIMSYKDVSNVSKENRGVLSGKGYVKKSYSSFAQVAEVLSSDCIFFPFSLKEDNKTIENIISSTNMLVFDFDIPYVPIETMHNLLRDYNHHLALTSNPDLNYKYRLIIELDRVYTIQPIHYKPLLAEINKQLLFDFTSDILPISQAYYGYKDREVLSVTDKQPFSIKTILSRILSGYRVKELTSREKVEKLKDVNILNTFSWAMYQDKGNRNSTLIRVINYAHSLEASKTQCLSILKAINTSFEEPLSEDYLTRCIYPHLNKKFGE